VSVTAHVNGRQLTAMHESWFGGNIAEAQRLHLQSLALTKAMFVTSNPVPIKHALKILGVLPNDTVRLPLVPVTTDESATIHAGLKQYGLL
jgi:4-hydroxy-tetrahydrodipicolinate synthase